MFQREREKWMKLLEGEREAHRKERQELLNRIAQPQRVVADPVKRDPRPPSKESQELAYIGQAVPDGVSVGSLRHERDG